MLPDLLARDVDFRARVFRLIDEEFASKRELTRVIDELARTRQEATERFLQRDRQWDVVLQELQDLRHEVSGSFVQVGEKLDQVTVTVEQMGHRLDGVEHRLDGVEAGVADLRSGLGRMEATVEQMGHRLGNVEAIAEETGDRINYLQVNVGRLQTRAGRNLEDAVAGALRVGLSMKDVDPSRIRMRQMVCDEQGLLGVPGAEYEFDLLIANGEAWIFEIKSTPDREAIEYFNRKADMAITVLGLSGARKALITLVKDAEVSETCKRLGIVLG